MVREYVKVDAEAIEHMARWCDSQFRGIGDESFQNYSLLRDYISGPLDGEMRADLTWGEMLDRAKAWREGR